MQVLFGVDRPNGGSIQPLTVKVIFPAQYPLGHP